MRSRLGGIEDRTAAKRKWARTHFGGEESATGPLSRDSESGGAIYSLSEV